MINNIKKTFDYLNDLAVKNNCEILKPIGHNGMAGFPMKWKDHIIGDDKRYGAVVIASPTDLYDENLLNSKFEMALNTLIKNELRAK